MGYRKLIAIGLTAALALSLTACAGEEETQDQEGVAGVAVQVQQVTRDTIADLLSVDKELWREDAAAIREFYGKFGDRLPKELMNQLDRLDANLK